MRSYGNPEKGKKKWNLWLTLRLLRKQKLRTAAIMCGMLFSGFLLTAFAGLGHDFWEQVHEGADEAAEYDSTQKILILLAVVLALLVTSCAGILLRNLFSLTFPQRWRSFHRLISLGAGFRDIIRMEIMGTAVLYGIAAPGGCMLAFLWGKRMGIRNPAPIWIIGAVMLWIFLVSCICGIRPLSAVCRGRKGRQALSGKKRTWRKPSQPHIGFLWYMTGKYHHANRGHYMRITVNVIAAILLYVPAGYLIDTNISVQQSGLYAKYGIQYNCSPQNQEELMTALREYAGLADCGEGGSMVCVTLDTRASIKTDAISDELRRALREAGWKEDEGAGDIDGNGQNSQGSPSGQNYREADRDVDRESGSRKERHVLTVDANILFVDDETFRKCLQNVNSMEVTMQDLENQSVPAILIDRYTNRSSWSEKEDLFFRETTLLAHGADGSEVEVYYDFANEYEPDITKYIVPDLLLCEIPEGIDFTGNLSLILPLRSMSEVCPADIRYGTLHVCGKFEDGLKASALFSRLEKRLGADSLGRLTDSRRILQEWYSSMEGIHRAMNAICLTLFSIALLNIFSMMIFQYMERKRGLAILWSAGQSPGGLFRLLITENIVHFLTGILIGIPLSAILCYYIYRIFRQAWQVTFALPIKQGILISLSALLVSAAAFLLNGILLRRQDFLADIREIT